MNLSTIRPAELRVTLREQLGDNVIPLGFAIASEPHSKAFANRKRKQDEWAYGINYAYDKGGKITKLYYTIEFLTAHKHRWKNQRQVVPDKFQPRVVANLPREGFQLVKSDLRSTASNKAWQVLDPYGFRMEISSTNLEEILMSGTVHCGVLQGNFVYEIERGKVKLVRV